MISRFFTTTMVIATPTGATTRDAEGQPIVTMTPVTTAGHVQPVAESERVSGQTEADARRTIWLPVGTTITHKSTVTYGGNRYEVIGDPRRWSVGSVNDHLEVTIARVTR